MATPAKTKPDRVAITLTDRAAADVIARFIKPGETKSGCAARLINAYDELKAAQIAACRAAP